MTTTRLVAALLIAGAALGAPPAGAQHLAPPPDATGGPEERAALDLTLGLTLRADGFRLGGRVFGPHGVWSGWLDGRIRPDGFALDGRVQDGERATDFRLDAEIVERLLRGGPGSSL